VIITPAQIFSDFPPRNAPSFSYQ